MSGVGAARISIGLASALGGAGFEKVLLVDCSRGFDIVSWLLKDTVSVAFDIGDVFSGICDPQDAIYRCDAGFDIIASAADKSCISAENAGSLVSRLDSFYDAIIVCCPCADYHFANVLSDFVSLSLILTRADELGIAASARIRRQLPEDHMSCGLVLYDYSSDAVKKDELLGIDDCIDRSETRLMCVVPEKKSARQKAYHNLAVRINGTKVPLIKL